MAALDIDTAGFRGAGHHVAEAGSMLHYTPGADVPACGADGVSRALMDNLNARQNWLNQHLAAGAAQAFNAARGIDDTVGAYQHHDQAAAASYAGGYSPSAPAAPNSVMPSVPAPSAPPTLSPIPTIADQDGEQMATDLEGGAGTGPALQAASHWSTISAQAMAANGALVAAQTQLLSSGESQAHGPIAARLARAIAWTTGVAGHAGALAAGYTSAADLHTTVKTAVGPSQDWSTRKERIRASAAGGPPARPLYIAQTTEYSLRQGEAGAAALGYQVGSQTVSTPPGTLPDPGLDPHTSGANADDDPASTPQQPPKNLPSKDQAPQDQGSPATQNPADQAPGQGSGMQDIMSSMMGALSPLMKAASSPMQGLGQLGQLAQQAAQMAGMGAKAAHAPIKPAALSGAHPGGAGGHHGGGGAGAGASLAGVHPASLSGTPSSTPPAGPMKPAAPMPAAGGGGGAPAGMMGGGHGKAENKTVKVNPAEAPLPDVEEAGRPGVVGAAASAKPEPVVNPAVTNAVKERLAARKKNLAGDDG